MVLVACLAVPIDDADARGAVRALIDQHLGGDGVRANLTAPGVLRGMDQAGRRVERCLQIAAAPAAAAAHAARPVSIRDYAVSRDAGAARYEMPAHRSDRLAENWFPAFGRG